MKMKLFWKLLSFYTVITVLLFLLMFKTRVVVISHVSTFWVLIISSKSHLVLCHGYKLSKLSTEEALWGLHPQKE